MSHCQIKCDKEPRCMSFNYNGFMKKCELLSTDLTLQNKSHDTVEKSDSTKSWVHRYLGVGKTKACVDGSNVWENCVKIWLTNSGRDRLARWEIPTSSQSGFVSNCEMILARERDPEKDTVVSEQQLLCSVNELVLTSEEPILLEVQVQNSKGFSLLTPLSLTVAERTKPASSFSTLSTSSNTEIRAQWELSDFVGQPIESLFIWTDPNDGNCRMQEYCEIILDPSTMGVLGVVDEQPRKYFDVTGLTPGRAYDVHLALFTTSGGASRSIKSDNSPRTLVPPMIESVNVDFDPGHPRSVQFDIQFSEVGEISAVEIVFEGLQKLTISGSEAAPKFGNGFDKEKGHDNIESSEAGDCYFSKHYNAWAKYFLAEKTVIGKVEILNAKNFGHVFNPTYIDVCDGSTCERRGTCQGIDLGKWCVMDCANGGIAGDMVLVTKDGPVFQYWLTVCEIVVWGQGTRTVLIEYPNSGHLVPSEGINKAFSGFAFDSSYSTSIKISSSKADSESTPVIHTHPNQVSFTTYKP